MTAASSPTRANGLSVAVVAQDPIVHGLLLRALHECRVRFVETTMERLARADETPDVVCAGPSAASGVLGVGFPTVIITRGLSVSDEVWAELVRWRPVVIKHRDLTPVTLVGGLLRAYLSIDLEDVPSHLSWVPPALLRGFLAGPRTLEHVGDFALAIGGSPKELRRWIRSIGCQRFEQMVTRLRADVWRWLVGAGVSRVVVESYLEVEDRSHFRRACRRAGIPVPWNGE